MRTRVYTPILALAGLVLLGCDSVATTSPLIANAPAFIRNGDVDGAAHPAVVLLVMDIAGQPAFRCTGTLIAPTLVLTAGHCAGEPGEFSGMRVFTESDVAHGNNYYPFSGPNTVDAAAWHAHPLFTESAFFLHDVGVVELKTAVTLPAGAYGTLPSVNQLDALHPSSHTRFTSVGYGVQRINPAQVEGVLVRMVAEPHLVQINTPGFTGNFSLLLSNNAATGGTCFGDSGGPNFLGSSNVVAAVTSFSRNNTCGGTGGVFRLDRQDVLTFVSAYLP